MNNTSMKTLKIALILLFIFGSVPLLHADETPPDFTLTSIEGTPFHLADVLGQKNIVINFWASWCDSCEEEIPKLTTLRSTAPADTVFLGINAGDSHSAAQKFINHTHYNYQILLDAQKSVAKLYGVLGLPQTLVINKSGQIVYRESTPPKTLVGLIK